MTKQEAQLNAMSQQRNQAMDVIVTLYGEIAERDETIKQLQEKLNQTEE